MGLSYSVVYNHVSLLFIFLLKLLQLWPLQTLSGGLLCPLTCPHPFVGICLLSGTKMCSMFICGGISLFLGTLVPFSGKWKLWVIIIFSLWFVCGMICIRVCQYFWSRVCLFNSHLFCGDIYNCIRIFCVAGNRKSDSSWHKREFSFFFFFFKGNFLFFCSFCSCKVQILSSRETFSFFLSLIYLS